MTASFGAAERRSQTGRGVSVRRSLFSTASIAIIAAMTISPQAFAQTLPSGGEVARGQATISQSGGGMLISQTSRNAVINWSDFSIGAGGDVRFDNGSGATLNRVTGGFTSSIDGGLSATGSLYLINRNGVIVGAKGVINAAGFAATTLDVQDDAFMAGGALRFVGDSRSGIVNLGSIQADQGNVLLVAHTVRNDGVVSASHGKAELLAAQEIFLASPDADTVLVSLKSDAATDETGVTNTGLIQAAQARMQAADGNLYALAINQSGVIRATGVSTQGGRIVLTADGGVVRQDGQLEAHNADGSGGKILVGGDYQGGNPAVANAASTIVTENAVMNASASATQGDGGQVVVWADKTTSFAGRIAARGGDASGDGGFVEVSGKTTLDFRPGQPIDLSAKNGRTGAVLLDPDQIEVVATVTGANQVAASAIEAGLTSANYVLTTSNFDQANGDGSITVNSALSWTSTNTLTLRSGNSIAINADITAANGALELYVGRRADAAPESGFAGIFGGASLDASSTISVGRLRYGVNASSLPTGYTLRTPIGSDSFQADGTLHVDTLELDLAGGSTGLTADNSQNAICAFRTTGVGDMGGVSIVDGAGDLSVRLNSTNSNSPNVSIVTPGNLTLEAGSSFSISSSAGYVTDVVLASTGGEFTNAAGASAFGSNLRYLIYSGTRAGTDKGGLNATSQYSRTYAGNPPSDYSSDTVSRFLFRQSAAVPELTYRANNLSRSYGDTNPLLTYSVSGLQAGDILANVVSGTPLLTTSAGQASGVGAYVISISQGTLTSSTYDFLFAPATLTVTAAPLTLDIANASRFYGDFNPALTARVTGLKVGDTAQSILAGWRLSTSATRASGVGNYSIGATWLGTGNINYAYTVNPGILTINPAPVTLALAGTSRIYGDANPDFRALAMLFGTYNGDTVADAFPNLVFTTAATTASSAGAYAVNVSGASNPNYLVTIGDIGALTIDKATLTISANNATRVYGDANPAFSVASITGWRNGDTLASAPGLMLASAATATSNVGSYAITPTGEATNYRFAVGTGVLTVTKAPVAVHLDALTRYYGDNNPTFTVTYDGLKNGETTLPGLQPVSTADLYSPVGRYVISAGAVTSFQNYQPTFYASVLTVAPRPLTVSVANVTRTYGANNPTLQVSVQNAAAWDTAQAGRYWIASTTATQRSNVGDYAITLAANPYGEVFEHLSNYAVTLAPGTLNITRARIVVQATPVTMSWGDGLPPLTYTLTGLMPWDTVATAGSVQLTTNASSTAAPDRYPITLNGTSIGDNYTGVLGPLAYVDIQRRQIFITGSYAGLKAQLGNLYPGLIEPFFVKRYEANGVISMIPTNKPLAGGPQFTVQVSTDGTRGDELNRYVTTAVVKPAAGYSLDDVLRYYDPVSKPGIAFANDLQTQQTILQKNVLPPTQQVEIKVPEPIVLQQGYTFVQGQTPPFGYLVQDAFPDSNAMAAELKSVFAQSQAEGIVGDAARKLISGTTPEFREYLSAAMANQNAYKSYADELAKTEAWIAELKAMRPIPGDYQAKLAIAQQDAARLRSQMNGMPNLETLRQKMIAGDEYTVSQFMPMMALQLMKDVQSGALSAGSEAAMVNLINAQRAKTIAVMDEKYNAFVASTQDRGLTTVISSPKIPDIVGSASVQVAAAQVTTTAAAAIGAAIVPAAIAGATLAAASLTITGTTVSLISNIGFAAVAPPLVVATIAVAIGVAEAVQVVESAKNYDRYVAYKANNKPIDSLQGLDMKNPDNAMQLIAALTSMVADSVGKLP